MLLFREKSHSDLFFGTALIIFIMAGGYLLYSYGEKRLSILEQQKQMFIVKLTEYPARKITGYSFRAKIVAACNNEVVSEPRGSLLLYFRSDSLEQEWLPGDILVLRLTPIPVKNNGNPCEFDYKRYLEGQGIRYSGFFTIEDLMEHITPKHRSLREISRVMARKMTDLYAEAGLHNDALGLVTALTLGEKEMLDKDILTSFSRMGAMHIMAVSGLHVGMISLFMSYLLFFLRRKMPGLRVLVIVCVLWAFAFITGLSPSVLRATIMFSFLQAGTLMNRPANSMNILLASAFMLIVARPAVLFEAGFQLSYLAVAFIIIFYQPLRRALNSKNKFLNYIWQIAAISLVAQAGTLALTIRLFNIFPLLFLITNMVVIPITFAVLFLSFLLVMISALVPVSTLIVRILEFLSHLTLDFMKLASSLPFGVIDNIGLTVLESFLLTIAIALLLTSLLRVARITLKPFLIVASLMIACGIYKNFVESCKEGPVVYNIKGKALNAYQAGRYLILYSDSGAIPAEVKKHASTRGLKIEVIPHK
mgnify:CR=1 FL=1